MTKKQTNRLRVEKIRGEGPKEIFGESAQKHDTSVNDCSKVVFETLQKDFPHLEFRFRDSIDKKEINEKLNSVDARLGVTIFVEKASIKPDGGIIEVKDKDGKWRIVLVCEAKHQGKDIENISKGILVGINNDQELMVAGNAIERSHKNIFISIDGQLVMLQAVSIYTKPTEWTIEEMLQRMIDVSRTSLKIIGVTEMKQRKVRVRFAPSPTGPLHIGGVRTALYNYLFARQQGGDFILRIEDTDSQRFVPGAEEYIIEALTWLGVRFNEGVSFGGEKGPYRQSERRAIYREYVDLLLDKGLAYIAFDTPEELDAKRNEIANFQYDASTRMLMRNSLTLPKEETDQLIAEGRQYVVRIRIEPGEQIRVNDLIRGEVIVNSSVLDDKVLFKSSDQLPTYHLANIVDDHLMEITHVIRGEEWLPSAPLHVLLYRCFGWTDTMPQFAHLSLLLKPEGNGKLSKRDGDRLGFPVFPLEWTDPETADISSGYRESGYLPEAVVNFLALLGWSPGNDREVMDMDEMTGLFDLAHCSKSGAKFDYEKGKWFNHQYIQMKSNAEIAALFIPVLHAHGILHPDPVYVEKVAGLMKERVNFVKELWDASSFFFKAPEQYDEKTVKKRWKAESPVQLGELAEVLRYREPFDSAGTEEAVKAWIESKEYHLGNLMNALRLALVGEGKGPHIFDITETLGKEETINRINRAICYFTHC